MRRLVTLITCILLIFPPVQINAGGLDLIRSISGNNRSNESMGIRIITERIKKKNKTEVKIIKNKNELKAAEKDKKLQGQLLGIDVSKWNGNIDWKEVKEAGIEFAIIRAGYGQNTVDIQFERNIKGCIENDIYVGVYWFSYAYTSEMAVKEAQFCKSIIGPYEKYIKLGVWFDFEYDSTAYATRRGVHITKDKCTNIAYAFCKEIEKDDYQAGIYTNIDYANNYFTKDILKEYNVWIADWSAVCRYDGKYLIWQYTDGGEVKGINGKVDMDWYYGDKQ